MKKQPLTEDSIMPYGKHKGKKMSEVDPEYYAWMLREYYKDNLKFRLGKMHQVMAYVLRHADEIQAHYAINTKKNFDFKKFIKK